MSVKYVVYECDTCGRQREAILDAHRPDPIRCNITLKCRGKFTRVGEAANKRFLLTPIVQGVTDFTPRGAMRARTISTATIADIPIITSVDNMLTLACLERTTIGDYDIFTVTKTNDTAFTVDVQPKLFRASHRGSISLELYEVTPEILSFKNYTFNVKGELSIVTGPDDSVEGKQLRFNSANQVRVFVNGLELSSGEFNRTIDDQVTFTPSIFNSLNIVEVLVYVSSTDLIANAPKVNLTFTPLAPSNATGLAARNTCCWGDYAAVNIEGAVRTFMFCSDLSALNVNSTYRLNKAYATQGISPYATVEIKTDDLNLVLGSEPFSFKDKELGAYLPLKRFSEGVDLKYQVNSQTGVKQLMVPETQITQTLNLLVPITNYPETTFTDSTTGSLTAIESEGAEILKRSFIRGPF